MDARNFAHTLGGEMGHFFPFGVDKDNAAAELRKFADAIESGKIVLQKIQSGSIADPGQYATQSVVIEFVEKAS
jgi:hypothetical protein